MSYQVLLIAVDVFFLGILAGLLGGNVWYFLYLEIYCFVIGLIWLWGLEWNLLIAILTLYGLSAIASTGYMIGALIQHWAQGPNPPEDDSG